MTCNVSMAPPVSITSVMFIAASMAIIEMVTCPLRFAMRLETVFQRITVSRAIEVKTVHDGEHHDCHS